MKQLYLLAFFIFIGITAHAQQNCTILLNRAEDDYEAGRLLGIEGSLTSCLANDGFSKEEKIRALKLLTLVNIFTDNDTKADEYLILLLKADPEHKLNPEVDPAELYYLYNQFRVKPIFRIAFRAGVNMSTPNIVESFSTGDADHPKFINGKTAEGLKQYRVGEQGFIPINGIGIGTNLELMIERHLLNGIELAGGPQLRISQFNVDQYLNNIGMFASVADKQTYLRVPILARYNLWYDDPIKKVMPYVYAGGSFDYLLSSTLESSRTGGTSYTLVDNNDFKANDQVYATNASVFGGIGTKFKVQTHFLSVEFRYDRSFGLYNKPENRWNNNQNTTADLAYVHDDIKLNYFSFSIGYTRSIYNPIKLTK